MKYLFIPFLMLSIAASAQIKVTNAEQYTLGSHIVYQGCSVNSFDTGIAGADVTWDYSNLVDEGGPTIIDVKRSSETRFASKLKNADLVEIDSDSTFVFFSQNDTISKLEYFVSIGDDLKMSYPKEQVFMRRPLEYLSHFESDYLVEFSSGPYSFKGTGSSTITSDGYGTLKLPNEEYKNILRVKIHQTQEDTLLLNQSIHSTISTTYLWFDGISPEPLLKITHIETSLGIQQTIKYRVYSNTTNISDKVLAENLVYPVPSKSLLFIKKTNSTNYTILNLEGKTVQSGILKHSSNSIDISTLENGVYYLNLGDNTIQKIIKI